MLAKFSEVCPNFSINLAKVIKLFKFIDAGSVVLSKISSIDLNYLMKTMSLVFSKFLINCTVADPIVTAKFGGNYQLMYCSLEQGILPFMIIPVGSLGMTSKMVLSLPSMDSTERLFGHFITLMSSYGRSSSRKDAA